MWRAICNDSHKNNGYSNDSQQELEVHIRHLHSKRLDILAAKRQYLLLHDVEEYLQTATTTQMEAWIALHEGPIKESIKRAAKELENHPQLTCFGFSVEMTEKRRNKKNGQSRKNAR